MLRRGIISTEDTIAQNGHINVVGCPKQAAAKPRAYFVNDSKRRPVFENLE
jgi:hypothetical protein